MADTNHGIPKDEPCYIISVAARMVSLHPQTLRYYDRIGLISPTRTSGGNRLYSQKNIETLQKIVRLTEDLGVNLAGVEVILNMSDRIEELQQERDEIRRRAEAEIRALRRRVQQLERRVPKRQTNIQVINVSAREIPQEIPNEEMSGKEIPSLEEDQE